MAAYVLPHHAGDESVAELVARRALAQQSRLLTSRGVRGKTYEERAMTKRAWTVVLALGLCLSTQGCGDDDGGEEDDGGSGGSSNAGRGGSGNAGRGSSNAGSGNSGSGSSDPIVDCMLDEMMGGGGVQDCAGVE
jgi:hypothetical protein